jgi:AmmeMemoRadiSam system protein A
VVGYGAYLVYESGAKRLSSDDRRVLLDLAENSIQHGIERGGPKAVQPDEFSAPLKERRATFVTLKLERALRGCVGSLVASRALVEDVCYNAHAAAFSDRRFTPVTAEEASRLAISISVLSPPVDLNVTSETDLLSRIRPGIDGLVIEEGKRRGTFLPAVWESLPEPADFIRQLKKKAGFSPGYWSSEIRFKRYSVESFS